MAVTAEELKKTLVEFKTENDERFKQIQDLGKADILLEEKVDKINSAISDLELKLEDEQKKLIERIDEFELKSKASEIGISAEQKFKEEKSLKEFQALVAETDPSRVVKATPENYKKYCSMWDKFIRVGNANNFEIQNAMEVGSQPDGGYWVTPDQNGRIAELIYETSPMRQICSVQGISTDHMTGTKDTDEGATGGWVAETGTRSATATPEIGEWKIFVHEQFAMPKVTQKLLDDASVNVESWLMEKISSKFSRTENDAFINGNGVGKPRGILTYPDGTPSHSSYEVIKQYLSGAAGAFAASNPGDKLIDMVDGLKSAYQAGASWLMSRLTWSAARKLKDGDGNYLFLTEFSKGMGVVRELLGYPVVTAEDMPELASDSLSIAFGDFKKAYQIFDRQGIRLMRDPFTDKPYVLFYTTKRTGGDMINFEAINIMKFASS